MINRLATKLNSYRRSFLDVLVKAPKKLEYIDRFEVFLKYTNQKRITAGFIKSHVVESGIFKGKEPPKKLLDIACGDASIGAEVTSCLQDNHADVHYTGIDLDEELIKRARLKLKFFGIRNYELVSGDCLSHDFTDLVPEPSLIIVSHFLYYVDDKQLDDLIRSLTEAMGEHTIIIFEHNESFSSISKMRREAGLKHLEDMNRKVSNIIRNKYPGLIAHTSTLGSTLLMPASRPSRTFGGHDLTQKSYEETKILLEFAYHRSIDDKSFTKFHQDIGPILGRIFLWSNIQILMKKNAFNKRLVKRFLDEFTYSFGFTNLHFAALEGNTVFFEKADEWTTTNLKKASFKLLSPLYMAVRGYLNANKKENHFFIIKQILQHKLPIEHLVYAYWLASDAMWGNDNEVAFLIEKKLPESFQLNVLEFKELKKQMNSYFFESTLRAESLIELLAHAKYVYHSYLDHISYDASEEDIIHLLEECYRRDIFLHEEIGASFAIEYRFSAPTTPASMRAHHNKIFNQSPPSFLSNLLMESARLGYIGVLEWFENNIRVYLEIRREDIYAYGTQDIKRWMEEKEYIFPNIWPHLEDSPFVNVTRINLFELVQFNGASFPLGWAFIAGISRIPGFGQYHIDMHPKEIGGYMLEVNDQKGFKLFQEDERRLLREGYIPNNLKTLSLLSYCFRVKIRLWAPKG